MTRKKTLRGLIHNLADATEAKEWSRIWEIEEEIDMRLNHLYRSVPQPVIAAVGLEPC